MIHAHFAAGIIKSKEQITSVEKFVDSFPDFQSVFVSNEQELLSLLSLLGFNLVEIEKLIDINFDKFINLRDFKFPLFDESQFESFYAKWIANNDKENSMDEYGQLVFLHHMTESWNNRQDRFVLIEKAKAVNKD